MRVSVTDGAGRPVRDGGLGRWLASIAPARAAGEVAIALVSDARVRGLNRQYRGKNAATDVLSFPQDEHRSRDSGPGTRARSAGQPARIPVPESRQAPAILGDIVIATGVARRQARNARHSYQSELRVLALHGLLHLLGYDHHDSKDRGRMARTEARLRRRGGLTAGLIERGLRPSDGRARA